MKNKRRRILSEVSQLSVCSPPNAELIIEDPYIEDQLQKYLISEAIAAGEIKLTGKSVSIDEVIDKIDEHLEKETQE